MFTIIRDHCNILAFAKRNDFVDCSHDLLVATQGSKGHYRMPCPLPKHLHVKELRIPRSKCPRMKGLRIPRLIQATSQVGAHYAEAMVTYWHLQLNPKATVALKTWA